jgi:hypothetical protein
MDSREVRYAVGVWSLRSTKNDTWESAMPSFVQREAPSSSTYTVSSYVNRRANVSTTIPFFAEIAGSLAMTRFAIQVYAAFLDASGPPPGMTRSLRSHPSRLSMDITVCYLCDLSCRHRRAVQPHLPSFHPVLHLSSHLEQSNVGFPSFLFTSLCASQSQFPSSSRVLARTGYRFW